MQIEDIIRLMQGLAVIPLYFGMVFMRSAVENPLKEFEWFKKIQRRLERPGVLLCCNFFTGSSANLISFDIRITAITDKQTYVWLLNYDNGVGDFTLKQPIMLVSITKNYKRYQFIY